MRKAFAPGLAIITAIIVTLLLAFRADDDRERRNAFSGCRGRHAAVMVSGVLLCGDCFLRLAIRAHTEAVASGKITASVGLCYCCRRRGWGSEGGRSS